MPDPTPLDNGTTSPAPDGVNTSRCTPLDEIERPATLSQLDTMLAMSTGYIRLRRDTVAALVAVARAAEKEHRCDFRDVMPQMCGSVEGTKACSAETRAVCRALAPFMELASDVSNEVCEEEGEDGTL